MAQNIFNIQKDVCSLSDVGNVRPKNEDNQGYTNTENGHIFVVCDGMGGHVAGELASKIAVETIIEYFITRNVPNIYVGMNEAIELANSNIYQRAVEDRSLRGMGTTVVLLVVKNDKIFIAHVGDSRIYIHSNGELHRITKDHSFVQTLVDKGTISDDDAEHHPRKNELMRALGIDKQVTVEVFDSAILAKNGDMFLMCSDGLNGMVNDLTMESVLNKPETVTQKGEELINLAKMAGGKDNITLTLIEITNSPHRNSRFVSKSPKRITIPKTNPDIKLVNTLSGNDFSEKPEVENKQVDKFSKKKEPEFTKNNEQNDMPPTNENEKNKKKLFTIVVGILAVVVLVVVLFFAGVFDKKPYEVLIIEQNSKMKLGYFETLDEAKDAARLDIEQRKVKAKFEIWLYKNKFASLEFTEDPDAPVIPLNSEENELNKSVVVPEGVGWKALYEEYGVCKCYIIESNPASSFTKDINLKANTTYIIPLHFSSKKEHNPKKYMDYSLEKKGYDNNGNCSKYNKCVATTGGTSRIIKPKEDPKKENSKNEVAPTEENTNETTVNDPNTEKPKTETTTELTPEQKKAAALKAYEDAKIKYEEAQKATKDAHAEYVKVTEELQIEKLGKKDKEKIKRLDTEITLSSNKYKDAQKAEKAAKEAMIKAKAELD